MNEGLRMKYFVLKPAGDTPHARASREAMRAYALSIQTTDEKLADELCIWFQEEEVEVTHGNL